MTDLSHPLTPWSHAQCVSLIRSQIERNVTARNVQIVAMYRAGASSRIVAEHFGLSRDAIMTIVRKADPALVRPRGGKRKAVAA